ncbi:MAG TPA: hypothetical protein PLI09_14325 [Candidatus Hydrogenedentes bacterium]|nr:hypothetical protein [Candidatus Hydrogenedentota bacterium]
MRYVIILAVMASMAFWAGAAGVTVTGAPGASLKEIINTSTLVTVILKDSGAKDANLRVIEVRPGDFTVLTEANERFTYLNEDVQEVQIQGGKVEKEKIILPKHGALRADDQKVLDRVWSRVKEIYGASNDNQERKIHAATILALHGDQDAIKYLKDLQASNEMQVRLDSALALFLVGEKPSEALLREGLESGNRSIRTKSACLSGLVDYRDAIPILTSMLQDRAGELSGPAARALAYLGDREIIPRLIAMLGETNELKHNAAIFALVRLGGGDIIEQMKLRLKDADTQERYRIGIILHDLNDPMGAKLLKEILDTVPTLKPEVALVLARENDWDATQYLRGRLARREDPTEPNLLYRARNAASMLQSDDPSALTVFQQLLRVDKSEIKVDTNSKVKPEEVVMRLKSLVFKLAIQMNDRKMLSIIQSSVENVDPQVALDACMASVALAFPDFRERYISLTD